jgi:hypothetical protein
MLKVPIKICFLIASIVFIILGIHGLWVHFNAFEAFMGGQSDKLLLSISVPIKLQGLIEWMSFKGLQSWFVPVCFIVLGFVLWHLQTKMQTRGIRLPKWLW